MSFSPRAAALDILRRWESGHVYAELLLARAFDRHPLSEADRSLVQALVYGVLRHRTLLDCWIDELRDGRLRPQTRDLLRLGIFQLLFLRIPDHAAVNETVELARQPAERRLVNAVLRRAGRERDRLLEERGQMPVSVSESVPAFLVQRWEAHFGTDGAAALCRWINQPARLFLRRNQLKPEALAALPEGLPLESDPRFLEIDSIPLAAIEAGACYIQDPSTVAACDLLAPAPGENVLDACAAPGGKTCLLAEHMNNEGNIIACDSSADRIATLSENLSRLGIANAATCVVDWLKLDPADAASSFPHLFDAILVDAPCSNTGVMRRRVDVRWRLKPGTFTEMADLQFAIASKVVPLLRPGGRLVYSTCSLEPEENRGVAQRLVETFPALSLAGETSNSPLKEGFDGAYAARLEKAVA